MAQVRSQCQSWSGFDARKTPTGVLWRSTSGIHRVRCAMNMNALPAATRASRGLSCTGMSAIKYMEWPVRIHKLICICIILHIGLSFNFSVRRPDPCYIHTMRVERGAGCSFVFREGFEPLNLVRKGLISLTSEKVCQTRGRNWEMQGFCCCFEQLFSVRSLIQSATPLARRLPRFLSGQSRLENLPFLVACAAVPPDLAEQPTSSGRAALGFHTSRWDYCAARCSALRYSIPSQAYLLPSGRRGDAGV